MFRGLNNLQSLSLYGNLISCVTPGAFDELTSMTSLNLISNPFNCNCHMAWFADWLRRRGLTNSGPRCVKPVHLKNKAIHSLATHEFRCTSKLINSQFKICLSLHHTVSQYTGIVSYLLFCINFNSNGKQQSDASTEYDTTQIWSTSESTQIVPKYEGCAES